MTAELMRRRVPADHSAEAATQAVQAPRLQEQRSGRKLRFDGAHEPSRGDFRTDVAAESWPASPVALAEFVFRHGEYFDSYLASEPEYDRFWSNSRRGLISYARSGRHLFVRGGLVAPPALKAELLEEFLEFCRGSGRRAHFLGIGESDLPLFRQFGLQVTKWGEEPIVDLTTCQFSGKPFEWVRRQTNYCTRMGVVTSEVRPHELSSDEWNTIYSELLLVAAESLATKAQASEMKFFEGQIESHAIGHRRLFIARSDKGAGRIEAFLLCNPILGGARWSTEMYRHRLDCVRGTVAFLFHQTMKQLQTEGVGELNLCLVPGLHCHEPIPGDSALIRRGFQYGQKWLNFVFDTTGLNHFKSRFRPRYESRFVCSMPTTTLPAILGFLHVLGVFNLSLTKTMRILYERFQKRVQRRNLATVE